MDEHLARGEARTLTGREAARFDEHIATCVTCRELANEPPPERERWIVSIPEDALDDPDLLVLPTVDPIVFAIDRELARGGMGRITRVRDRRLGRDVAIKEVLDPAMRARFEREVAITAQLQHPAIVPIYEAGTWPDGSAFYTMRLVSGGTLAEAIAKTQTLEERLALLPHVLALTDALAYAHASGIVHRDLKPGNVLVGEFGETVVIDWGLAKELRLGPDAVVDLATARGHDLTRAGSVLGTPGFMAPEQAAGADVDERADVYALGAILYTVLAGVIPYAGHDPDETIELARTQPPTPLAMLAPRAPADLHTIVDHAMAREPADRFANAKEMADELRRFQAGQLLQSREYGARELIARWIRKHSTVVVASALAVTAVAVIGVSAIVNVTRSRAAAEASVTTLLEEQGRVELVAGEPERAATLLVEAYRRGDDSPALRHMLAAATRDLDLQARTIDRESNIDAFAFRDDGSLVIADYDGIAILRQGKPVESHAYGVHVQRSYSTTLTPDTRRVFIVTGDEQAQLNDVATGAMSWRITTRGDAEIVFDATSTRFVLATKEATELRDAETGALVATLPGTDERSAVSFAEDGAQLAVCASGELVVADARTGARISSHPGCAGAVAMLDLGRVVVQSDCCALQIWSPDGGRTLLTGSLGEIAAIVVHAGAQRIVATDSAGMMTMWDSSSAQVGTAQTMSSVPVFSPNGELLAAGGPGEPLHVWNTDAFQLVHAIRVPSANRPHFANIVTWSRDGTQLATVRQGDNVLTTYRVPRGPRIFRQPNEQTAIGDEVMLSDVGGRLALQRIATGEVLARFDFELADLAGYDLDRAGRRALIIAKRDHQATVLDVQTRTALSTFPALPFAMLSGDGSRVLESTSSSTDPMQLRLRDAASGRVLHDLAFPEGEYAMSPSGDRIAMTGRDSIRLVDATTGKDVAVVPFDRTPLHVAFDPTGRRVFGYGSRSTPRIVDARTAQPIAQLPPPAAALESATFDAAGARVLTWGSDRTAQLWDTSTGALLATVGRIAFGGIALSPDGLRFATVTEDGAIQIWDARRPRLLAVLPADRTGIGRLAWSPDGSRLLSRGRVHTTVWDVHLETRTPAELTALATGWKLTGSVLVGATR